MRGVLVLVLAVPALGDVPPVGPACRTNDDCVMSAFSGCCSGGCCPEAPSAWSRRDLERAQRRCAIVDCAAPRCTGSCAPQPSVGPQVAVCNGGRCEARAAAPPVDFCASAADCVVSTFSCCPGCCGTPPRVVSRRREEQDRASCARRACGRRADCSAIACAMVVPSAVAPACENNRCVAAGSVRPELPAPPPAQCTRDSDCSVDLNPPPGSACWSTPCGCCPLARAVPVEQVRPPPRRATGGSGPAFGLSQGSQPSCSACPPVAPSRAVCRAGACTLTPN